MVRAAKYAGIATVGAVTAADVCMLVPQKIPDVPRVSRSPDGAAGMAEVLPSYPAAAPQLPLTLLHALGHLHAGIRACLQGT